MDAGFLVCAVLGGLCLAQALVMLLHGWEHRRFYRRRRVLPLQGNSPLRVTLIAPCKGIDANFRGNLLALFRQWYPQYSLCFVVESADDPAVPVIERLARENPEISCRIVMAGLAQDCGQKVHNLMCASRVVLAGPGEAPDVLAFVDSDACPHSEWLARLVERLASGKHAVSTGYRWYIPATRHWANRLVSAINNTIINLTGPHGFNLAWGGAWAIRTEAFKKLGLPNAWAGSLSDDLVVSGLVHGAGFKVGYEPHCLVTSTADFNWAGCCEFLRRQFIVARVYAPVWWHFGFWSGLVTQVAWWGTFACAWQFARTGGPWAVPLAVALLSYVAGVCRLDLAARVARPFINAGGAEYRWVARWNVWGWPIVSLATWLAVASAIARRTITWRGITYRLDSPRQTTILRNCNADRNERHSHARTATRAA
jgi:cellulose synthase/poly-beta-1,6-N-acetylglucosamine synthase-like glycosyltransferase